MTYQAYVNGAKPASKKALKEAIATNPASVMLRDLSFHGARDDFFVTDMPLGLNADVVGPNPERSAVPADRKWYATVRRTAEKVICQ